MEQFFRKLTIGLLFLSSMFISNHMSAQETEQFNPYSAGLNSYLGRFPSVPTLDRQSTNSWFYTTVAKDILVRVWGLTDSQSTLQSIHRQILQSQVNEEIEYLFDMMSPEGRWWWPGGGRTGDPNVDRFVLYPLVDAIYRLSEAGVVASDRLDDWMERLRPAIEFQFSDYGGGGDRRAGSYPNMDVAYLLIMGLAGQLYDKQEYLDTAHRFVHHLRDHLLPNGAFNYINTMHEAIGYHDIVIMLLGRYYKVTGDKAALKLIGDSVDYYPLTLGRHGVPERTSHPWWKHNNLMVGNAAPMEIVASVTSDGENKWLANLLMSRVSRENAYYAVDYYRSDIEPIEPEDNVIIKDLNISGVRGRFGDFSWVGSLGPRQDAFAGAIVVNSRNVPPTLDGSLLFVTPEIGFSFGGSRLADRTAFITGLTYDNNLIVSDELASLSVRYRPRRQASGQEMPEEQWAVAQSWLFLPTHVIGLLQMESIEEHQGRYVRMRVRTEPGGKLVAVNDNVFKSGRLNVHLLHNNFPQVRTGRAESHDWLAPADPNADEIFLEEEPLTDRPWRLYEEGHSYVVALETYPEELGGVQSFEVIEMEGVLGFGVSVNYDRFVVLQNISSGPLNADYILTNTDVGSADGTPFENASITIYRSSGFVCFEGDVSPGRVITLEELSPYEHGVVKISKR